MIGDIAPQFKDPVSELFSPVVGAHDWQQDAACAGMDWELFFRRELYPAARAVCAGCPVIDQCREWNDKAERLQGYGMDPDGLAGVYAGEDPQERTDRRAERERENPRERPRGTVVSDRDDEITDLVEAGDRSLREIGARYGITPQRVSQIAQQNGVGPR